jgi:acyl-CoA synthetase (AMP-forming)/AMP-acid ligase II
MSHSITALLRTAIAKHSSKGGVALDGPDGTVSYAALGGMIDGIAVGAHRHGIAQGTLVGLIAPKTVQGVTAFFGLMQSGLSVCFMEPKLAPAAIADQMDIVAMTYLVVADVLIDTFGELESRGVTVIRLSTLVSQGQHLHEGEYIDAGLCGDDGAMVLFTSGSAGRPKGVLLTHGNLICNATGVLHHTDLSKDDRLLHVMPLYHTNGINNQLVAPFLAGACVVLIERFQPEQAVMQLSKYRASYMTGVPTMYARMIPHLQPGDGFPSLRFLRCGSAPISETLHRQIEAAFGVELVVSYGLSEATCTSTMNPPGRRKIGTVGTVLRGQTVKLFRPGTDIEVAPMGEGEIHISGPGLMTGYLGDDVEQPIANGWLRTGDLGQFDADGYLSITGRIKDVIIRGGENISPALVEKHMVEHPTVRDCCVVGAAHADLGEVPVAFVTLRADAKLDEGDLKDFIKSRLARIYVPERVHVLEALPTNSLGKIDRTALRGLLPRAKVSGDS